MKRPGISKQILIIAILPALVVTTILSAHYISDQFNYISESLNKNGKLIVKQLSPAAEYAIYSGNIELIAPLVDTIIQNNPVVRVQILDKDGNDIMDKAAPEQPAIKTNAILKKIFGEKKLLILSEPIITKPIDIEDDKQLTESSPDINEIQIGKVIVTLTTQYATDEKIEQIVHGTLITLFILLLTTLVTIRFSSVITQPIKSLTRTVRNITSGDLDTPVDLTSVGELGILESCIKQMKDELKESRTDLESQLDVYTDELQQTLEELEIRNAELDITRSKAIYANKAKSEFLANMSHEIRTPLSGVIGFTELLQGTPLSSQQADYTDTIQKSAKNLLEIINDILDLSKIESGKTEIATSEFNVVDIIEDIINLLIPTALDKDIELFYRIENDVPCCIHADPFRIHQVLTNLIGNAIKFTDKGYVYLQVTLGEINNTETSIKFTVSDTGIGMNSSDKKKLFKAFTQADTSITRRFGGTGLGLVISRKLTLLMQGEIDFDSRHNEGSTFWFTVPVTAVPCETRKCELKDKKIAFVCNHAIARQTYKTLFEVCQCQVNDYSSNNLDNLAQIEKDNDIIILFLSREEINDNASTTILNNLKFTLPSMLIASTRSHTELRDLQQHIFDCAVFSSEKIEHIRRKIANTVNRDLGEPTSDNPEVILPDSFDWSDINIMVVDDNDINLRLAEIILHQHRARVTTARSGSQAVNYASRNSFDIIFMDLHMPGIDGYETTQQIREITPAKQPVIIALTANTLPQEKDKVIRSGMNGIIIKPVNDLMLQKVISQWVLKDSFNCANDDTDSNRNISDNHDKNDFIFSIELAKKFTNDNEDLAYELFGMLRGELADYKKLIAIAVADKDLTELRNQVHKLHGASRCCGTSELKKISSCLENLILNNIEFDIHEETNTLLAAIKNVEEFDIESTKVSN